MRFAVVAPMPVRNAEISFPLPMALTMKTLGAMPGVLTRRYTARLSKRLRAR
jgi:hypothetical protein